MAKPNTKHPRSEAAEKKALAEARNKLPNELRMKGETAAKKYNIPRR